jgi:hypothetical protein
LKVETSLAQQMPNKLFYILTSITYNRNQYISYFQFIFLSAF